MDEPIQLFHLHKKLNTKSSYFPSIEALVIVNLWDILVDS